MSLRGSHILQLSEIEQRALDEFVTRLQERLNGDLLSVTLFGSRARAEGGPDSDLDVLVVVERDDLDIRRAIRHLAADIWLAYGPLISTRIWDREQMERRKREPTLLARNIERDGIVLLQASRAEKVSEEMR